jgi:hypothetical protein
MTGFRTVTVPPQCRCNLPSDLEIGAAGRKRKQRHSPDQTAGLPIGDRPSAHGQAGFIALRDPFAQELAHVWAIGDQRERRTQPTRNLRRSVYSAGSKVVVELPWAQPETSGQYVSGVRIPFDVTMIDHVASRRGGMNPILGQITQ